MELFNSYQTGQAVFCDATTEFVFPDPFARILCFDLENFCGPDCSSLGVNNGFILCDCGDSWNCNLCANDLPFWIPFETGDTFDFQFQQKNRMTVSCENGWLPTDLLSPTDSSFASFEIRACCDDTPLEITEEMFSVIAPNHYVGNYVLTDYAGNDTLNPIQMIRFDLNAIATYMAAENLEPCFYFLFNFSASNDCLPAAESVASFCSEPFKMIPCSDGKKSQLMESIYPKLDCFGQYYGDQFSGGGTTPFVYSNRIRVPGSFEKTNFSITKEIIGTSLKTTQSQYCHNWLLRTPQMPERFTEYMVNLLTGRDVYVNGVEYQTQGEIQKNNETGLNWFAEINFQRCECNQSLTCE